MMRLRIEGLFYRFNYDIEIKKGEIITITGANGFGKSTIINMLNAIGNSDIRFFFQLEFRKISIEKEDNNNTFILQKQDGTLIFDNEKLDERAFAYFWRGLPIEKIAIRRSSYQDEIIRLKKQKELYDKLMHDMKDIISSVRLIREQRIIIEMEDDDENAEAVERIPEKLALEIQNASNAYANISNELDGSYPERLFKGEESISKEEFFIQLDLMQKKIEKLRNNGITNVRNLEISDFKEEDAKALAIYFNDFNQKYKAYENLVERIELFCDIVNRRFSFKYLKVSYEKGFEVIDDTTEKDLELYRLSSGEKEIIVLFYEILFETPNGSVLLIDEPEISLHISWQRLFISDLVKIAKHKHLTVVVATHSPQIALGDCDKQIDLGEQYQNERFDKRK